MVVVVEGCGPFDGGRDEGLTNDKNNGRYAVDDASQVERVMLSSSFVDRVEG